MGWRPVRKSAQWLTSFGIMLLLACVDISTAQFSSTLTCQKGNSGTDIIELCTGSGTLEAGEQVFPQCKSKLALGSARQRDNRGMPHQVFLDSADLLAGYVHAYS